jgi:hypothetical protein
MQAGNAPNPNANVPDSNRLTITRRDGGTDALSMDVFSVSNDSFLKSSLGFLPWAKASAAQDARWEVDYALGAAALLPPLAPTTELRLAMGRAGTPGFLLPWVSNLIENLKYFDCCHLIQIWGN